MLASKFNVIYQVGELATGRDAAGNCTSRGMALLNLGLGPGSNILGGLRVNLLPPRALKLLNKTDQHHVFPQAEEFADRWLDAGIDIHDYAVEIPSYFHRKYIHGIQDANGVWRGGGNSGGWWNNTWREFFGNNPNASPQEIMDQMEAMRRHWGIDDLRFRRYYNPFDRG